MRRRVQWFAVVLVLAVGAYLDARRRQVALPGKQATAEDLARLDARRHLEWDQGRFDQPGFERMKPPVLGEWLFSFPENGQTYEEYIAAPVNKRAPGRETIYFRPLGPLSERARASLEPVRRFATAFFQVPVKVVEEKPIFESALARGRNGGEDQYDADAIAAELRKERPEDALAYVGLADRDLYSGTLNFVFGIGTFHERTGVYSLVRFGEGEGRRDVVWKRRTFGLVAHELGHMLTIEHCIFYRCEQNGSLSIVETDKAPLHACPVCLAKLEWNLGFDRKKRYRDLAEVYRGEGLEDEARFCEERSR